MWKYNWYSVAVYRRYFAMQFCYKCTAGWHHSNISAKFRWYTQGTSTCFGQPCGHLRKFKIQRLVTLKLRIGSDTCITLLCTFNVPKLYIWYPWGKPHRFFFCWRRGDSKSICKLCLILKTMLRKQCQNIRTAIKLGTG